MDKPFIRQIIGIIASIALYVFISRVLLADMEHSIAKIGLTIVICTVIVIIGIAAVNRFNSRKQ